MSDQAPPRGNGTFGLASAIITSLKESPGLLVIVILNVIVIGTLFWSVRDVTARRDANLQRLMERCFPPDIMPGHFPPGIGKP